MSEFKYRWTLILTAGFVPFASLIYFIVRFHVNVPFGDEWEIAEYLERWDNGRISVAYLLEQHNEHRIFFPRIILLLLAKLTHWNLLYEELLNAALAASTYVVLAHACLLFEKWAGRFYIAILVVVLPWIVFSARQWENWSWGFQNVVFLSTFAAILGLFLLAIGPVIWVRFFAAISLGVVSQYSFSSGFAYWPVGFGLLCFADYSEKFSRRRALVLWCAASVFFSAFYLWGFNKHAHHPTLSYSASHPFEFIRYVAAYLGSLVNRGKGGFTTFVGGLALSIYIGIVVLFYRKKEIPRQLLLVAASFGLYSILNALMTAVGRAGFGGLQSLSSRYVTISYPFWVSVLLLGALFYHSISNSCVSRTSKFLIRGTQVLIFVGFSLILFRSASISLKAWSNRSQFLRTTHAQLLQSEGDELILQKISTVKNIEPIRRHLRYMRENKISFYAE